MQREAGQSFLMLIFAVAFLSAASAALYALLTPSVDTSREIETRLLLDQWKSALERYKIHHGGIGPESLEILLDASGGCVFDSTTSELTGDCGPYLISELLSDEQVVRDAWGNLLSYNEGGGTLSSCGADGACGTGDDWSVSF
jgi:hypothetical protein